MPKDPDEKRGYNDSLRAVAIQASQLLTSNSVDETIPAILATIGEALSVDRVLVLENKPTGIALCYAWQQASVPQVTRDDFLKYPSNTAEVREWFRPAFEGRWVVGKYKEVNGPVADLFRGLEIKAILIVPIMVAGKVWGFIGVDACKVERDWVTVEVELMEILANLIGTTILRDRDIKSLRENEQKFRTVAETAQDAIIVVDSKGIVQYWNPAARRILGYTQSEAKGQSVHQWIAPTRYGTLADEHWDNFASSGSGVAIGKTRELAAIRKDGVEIPVELALASMQVDGEWCAVGILRDISARKAAEQRIAWLARNDVLTGLPNRTVFVNELQSAIGVLRRKSAGHFAVYYLDLDHFKDINDTLGHAAGDLLLKGVAERLKNTMRETDIVARFGGDEFAILATELNDPTDAGIVAGKLLSALAR
ncbi:MAG TPA: diguanylate cyclase, partial [Candidatus Acidoferrum sp.]|nr:diguanylate cyclase [Candidatus Acidoferrum sp.]